MTRNFRDRKETYREVLECTLSIVELEPSHTACQKYCQQIRLCSASASESHSSSTIIDIIGWMGSVCSACGHAVRHAGITLPVFWPVKRRSARRNLFTLTWYYGTNRFEGWFKMVKIKSQGYHSRDMQSRSGRKLPQTNGSAVDLGDSVVVEVNPDLSIIDTLVIVNASPNCNTY